MHSVREKIVIVLGAAGVGNMGQVMARRFASEGAKVMVAGRNKDNLRDLADEIGGSSYRCDITNQADLEGLVAATLDRFGKLDVAINATGYGLLKPFLDTTRADLDYMNSVQFTGPFQFFQEVIKRMADGGSIIQISSATATIMLDNHAAYMGTKAGIDHVIRCIANEYGERRIRANSISPGLTDTPMAAEAFHSPALVELFRKEYPLGRIGTAEDVAEAALWLASDGCFVTGQNLQVNGGLTLRRNPRQKEIEALFASPAAPQG